MTTGRYSIFNLALGLIVVSLVLGVIAALLHEAQPAIASMAETRDMIRQLGGSESQPPIIAFVADYCPACREAEKYFRAERIPYLRADIEDDHVAREIYRRLASRVGSGIPKIVVGTKVLTGFSRAEFARAVVALGEAQ